MVLEVLKQLNVVLEDLAAIVHQGTDVNADDHDRKNDTVHDHAHPHPAKHNRLRARPRALFQNGRLPRLHAECNGGRQVGDQNEKEDLKRRSHDGDARHDAKEDLQDLGDVHRHDEGHKFLNARVDGATLLHGCNDGAEVVVREDHVGSPLGHLSTLDAHGYSDVGLVQCRRIVHAVASHGRDLTLALQRLHDLKLVFRPRSSEDPHCGCQTVHLAMRQVVVVRAQASTIHRRHVLVVFLLEYVHIACDRNRGLQVVASDHDDTDACTTSKQHRLRNTIPIRIDRSHHADKPHSLPACLELLICGDILVVLRIRKLAHAVGGDGQDTKGLGRVLVNHFQDFLLCHFGHFLDGSVCHQLLGTVLHDEVGCTFADREELAPIDELHATGAQLRPARDVADGQHHLPRRRERHLEHTRVLGGDALGEADLPRGHNYGCLRGIPLWLVFFLARLRILDLLEGCVATQEGGKQGRLHRHVACRVVAGLRIPDATHGRIEALALDAVGHPTGVHFHHSHLALGEGAGLVAANNRGRSEGLHGRQLAHQDIVLDHFLAADGERDRHTKRDALRNGRNGQGDSDEDHVEYGALGVTTVGREGGISAAQDDSDDEDENADENSHHADAGTEGLQAHLQRRGIRRRVGQAAALSFGLAAISASNELGDSADARVHACLHNDALALATGDAAAGEDHIFRREFLGLALPLASHLPGLGDVLGLARERHLADLDVKRLHEPQVRGHHIAGAEDHEVAADNGRDLDADLLTSADHVDGGLRHLGQRFECVPGLVLRPRGDAGVDEHDDEDRHAGRVGQNVILLGAGGVHDDGGDGGDHQEDDDEAAELHDEEDGQRRFRNLLELVGSIPVEVLCGLLL
mmetsp:Transcript_18189/g.63927  ORF Transcript_18189/g.63927 Transcript_18189/m.63927 type:complete len:865 (-) Transcript_18189:138-2732(-)